MTQINIRYHWVDDPSYISSSMEVVQYWQIAASIKHVNLIAVWRLGQEFYCNGCIVVSNKEMVGGPLMKLVTSCFRRKQKHNIKTFIV